MSKWQDTPLPSVTVRRIEEAVAQIPVIGEIRELEIRPRVCGVYFLLFHGEIVYVGQSKDVVARVNQHVDEHLKDFDRVLYIPCPTGLLDYYEKRLIAVLRPKYNNTVRRRMGTAAAVVHILSRARDGLAFEEILHKAEKCGVWAQTRSSLEINVREALERNSRIRFCMADQRYRIIHPALEAPEVQNSETSSEGAVFTGESSSLQ